jgi:hypothetical protein
MPVRRFRNVADMNQPTWRKPGDPALFQSIALLWEAGHRMAEQRFPPGVYRHRSIETMDAKTNEWALANFRAFHAARRTLLPDASRHD